VVEGKISFTAKRDGLFRVDRQRLLEFNLLGEVMCATLHDTVQYLLGKRWQPQRLIPLVGQEARW